MIWFDLAFFRSFSFFSYKPLPEGRRHWDIYLLSTRNQNRITESFSPAEDSRFRSYLMLSIMDKLYTPPRMKDILILLFPLCGECHSYSRSLILVYSTSSPYSFTFFLVSLDLLCV